MTTLNEPMAKRIATLFRMLGSNFQGEVLGAVAAMKRLFSAEGLSFHDIATVIESCNGEIEERKYSDADAEVFSSAVSRRVALSNRTMILNSSISTAIRAGTRWPRSASAMSIACAARGKKNSPTTSPARCLAMRRARSRRAAF